jgi:hypothetical protein
MEFNKLEMSTVIKFGAITGEIFIIAIMVIFLIFSFILTRRIKVMNLNLKTPYAKVFEKISKIHTLATLIVIILSLLALKI